MRRLRDNNGQSPVPPPACFAVHVWLWFIFGIGIGSCLAVLGDELGDVPELTRKGAKGAGRFPFLEMPTSYWTGDWRGVSEGFNAGSDRRNDQIPKKLNLLLNSE